MADWPWRMEMRDAKINSMIMFYATGWREVSIMEGGWFRMLGDWRWKKINTTFHTSTQSFLKLV